MSCLPGSFFDRQSLYRSFTRQATSQPAAGGGVGATLVCIKESCRQTTTYTHTFFIEDILQALFL